MSTPYFYRPTSKETKLVTETLGGIQSSDERARSVLSNIKIIIASNNKIAAEKATATPDIALINKCNGSVSSCTRIVKENLAKLGADDKYISEVMGLVTSGDVDSIYVSLLKLLVKRNPGLYRRRLAAVQNQK